MKGLPLLILVGFVAIGVSCSSSPKGEPELPVADIGCNSDQAYSDGLEDGRSGRVVNSDYGYDCPPDQLTDIQNSYKRGYRDGQGEAQASDQQVQDYVAGNEK